MTRHRSPRTPAPVSRAGGSRPRRGLRQPVLLLGLAVAASLSVLGCGDTFVDPFVRDQGSFSIYGVLVAGGSPTPQRLRVQVVRTLPDPPTEPGEPATQIPVEVTSQMNGAMQAWDSTHVRLSDGTLGAVFASTFRPQPQQTVQIRVQRRTDGAEASAEVAIPPVPQATAPPARVNGERVTQTVSWDSRVLWVQVRYLIFHPSINRFEAVAPVYPLPADGVFELDMVRDREVARRQLIASGELPTSVILSRIEVEILGTQETAWPALPDADAEAGQPGAYSNVTGGYGLVVGATRGTVIFRPDREAARTAGFEPSY